MLRRFNAVPGDGPANDDSRRLEAPPARRLIRALVDPRGERPPAAQRHRNLAGAFLRRVLPGSSDEDSDQAEDEDHDGPVVSGLLAETATHDVRSKHRAGRLSHAAEAELS